MVVDATGVAVAAAAAAAKVEVVVVDEMVAFSGNNVALLTSLEKGLSATAGAIERDGKDEIVVVVAGMGDAPNSKPPPFVSDVTGSSSAAGGGALGRVVDCDDGDNVCVIAKFHDVTRTNCDDKKKRLQHRTSNTFVGGRLLFMVALALLFRSCCRFR